MGREWEFVPATKTDREAEGPESAVDYWREEVETWLGYCPELPWMAVLVLDEEHRIRGHGIRWLRKPKARMDHRRVFIQTALRFPEFAFVLMRNGLGQSESPTLADERSAAEISHAAELLDIRLLDQITVAAESYHSKLEAEQPQTIIVETPIAMHHAIMNACQARGITYSQFAREAVMERIERGNHAKATT